MGLDQVEEVLQAHAPADLTWAFRQYTDETHLSTWVKGFWDGLKFCYGGYYADGIRFKPMDGIVLQHEPFKLWCFQRDASSHMRYTLDGTEPTVNSLRVASENTFSLSRDTTFTIKSFCNREQYDATTRGRFKLGGALPGVKQLANGMAPGGLQFAYYEGSWDAPPDVQGLTPARTGRADGNFDITKSSDTTFVCVLEGFLKIDADGYYIFELDDNGHSQVFVGGAKVIGDHFDLAGGASFMLPLRNGFHQFRMVYFHRKGERVLAPVYIKPEGRDDSPIPVETLYSPMS